MANTQSSELFKPARRISGGGSDVYTMVNSAAAASPVQPVANLGQGFFGYNPPQFIIDAAKEALDRVDCNQYSPTKGRPRLKKALANAYSPFFGRQINPETEVSITSGANEGMLCALMAFVEPGEEIILLEPFFDQYLRNIQLVHATAKYVPLSPPANSATDKASAADWTLDMEKLAAAITPKTKMIFINSPLETALIAHQPKRYTRVIGVEVTERLISEINIPRRFLGCSVIEEVLRLRIVHNPIGKVFSRDELLAIGNLCVKHSIMILSDEVYDRLYYVPFTRIATLSEEIAAQTLTFGSIGKAFYCTGWRVGYVIGPDYLISHVCTAHTRICYAAPGPQQEAAAVGYEEGDSRGFWEEAKTDMKGKIDRFTEVLDDLDLPYTDPQGGYFVLVNTKQIRIPEDYAFPPDVGTSARDFKLSWWLAHELGVASIPPSGFYSPENAHLAENYLRFAVCKNEDVLELAKARLRGLKKYLPN